MGTEEPSWQCNPDTPLLFLSTCVGQLFPRVSLRKSLPTPRAQPKRLTRFLLTWPCQTTGSQQLSRDQPLLTEGLALLVTSTHLDSRSAEAVTPHTQFGLCLRAWGVWTCRSQEDGGHRAFCVPCTASQFPSHFLPPLQGPAPGNPNFHRAAGLPGKERSRGC